MGNANSLYDEIEGTRSELEEVSYRISFVRGQLEPEGDRPNADDIAECLETLEAALEHTNYTEADEIAAQVQDVLETLKSGNYYWDDVDDILNDAEENARVAIEECNEKLGSLDNTGHLPEYDAYLADMRYDEYRDRLILGMEY